MKTLLAMILALFLFAVAFSGSLATEHPRPASARQMTDAAVDYEQAFKALSVLTEADQSLLAGDVDYQSPSATALILKVDPALRYLHRGSMKPTCDWGLNLQEEGAAAVFPHLAKAKLLANCALFRARSNWAQGRKHESLKDLCATIALANHVGAKGTNGFVSLLAQYEMEALALSFIFDRLKDASAAEIFSSISDTIQLPTDNAPKTALLLERDVLIPWVKQYVNASRSNSTEQKTRVRFLDDLVRRYGRQEIVDAVEETRNHYTTVADLLDLPPDEFEKQFDLYINEADIASNPFSKTVILECPAIKRSYYERRQLLEQWLRFKREVNRYLTVSQDDREVQPVSATDADKPRR